LNANLSDDLMLFFVLLSFLAGAVTVGKLYFHATVLLPKIKGFMPKLSMFGIVYFKLITTAESRENIINIGLLMLTVSILHNSLGYTFS